MPSEHRIERFVEIKVAIVLLQVWDLALSSLIYQSPIVSGMLLCCSLLVRLEVEKRSQQPGWE